MSKQCTMKMKIHCGSQQIKERLQIPTKIALGHSLFSGFRGKYTVLSLFQVLCNPCTQGGRTNPSFVEGTPIFEQEIDSYFNGYTPNLTSVFVDRSTTSLVGCCFFPFQLFCPSSMVGVSTLGGEGLVWPFLLG